MNDVKVYVLRQGGILVRGPQREEVVHEPLIADGASAEDAVLALAHAQDAIKQAAKRVAPPPSEE